MSASAREKNNSWKNRKITTRSWKVAEALTRQGTTGAERGPYAHLVGDQAGQISVRAVALLVERYTPAWADVRAVMQGLVHAATGTTGYVALGLRTRPRSAWAWLNTVLGPIAWDQQDAWPTWSVTARAFGVDWRGTRHRWGKESLAEQSLAAAPAPASVRARAMEKIRGILNTVKS